MKLNAFRTLIVLAVSAISFSTVCFAKDSSSQVDLCVAGNFVDSLTTTYGAPQFRIMIGDDKISLTQAIRKYSSNPKESLQIKESTRKKDKLTVAEITIKCKEQKNYKLTCVRLKSNGHNYIQC